MVSRAFRLPDLTQEEVRSLGVKGVTRRQIQKAFPLIPVQELNEILESLKDWAIYEPLPGVFRCIPYPKEEWHLLDIIEES